MWTRENRGLYERTGVRYRTADRPIEGGPFLCVALAVGELDHMGDVADEFDLEAILGRPNFHLIYEAAQQIQCLIAELRVPPASRAERQSAEMLGACGSRYS